MPGSGLIQIWGVFNQCSIQPPSLPAPLLETSSPTRPLRCYAADTSFLGGTNLPNRPLSSSRPVSAAAPSRASRLSNVATRDGGDDKVAGLAAELFGYESEGSRELELPSAPSVRRSPPRAVRSANRRGQTAHRSLSPRRQQLGVMDSLMHHPSSSITQAVLAPHRAPSTPRR